MCAVKKIILLSPKLRRDAAREREGEFADHGDADAIKNDIKSAALHVDTNAMT